MRCYKIFCISVLTIGIYVIGMLDCYKKYSDLATLNLMYSGATFALFTYIKTNGDYRYHLPEIKNLACSGPYSCLNNICELTRNKVATWVGIDSDDNINVTGCSNNYEQFLDKFDNYKLFGNMIFCCVVSLVFLFVFTVVMSQVNKKYIDYYAYQLAISYIFISMIYVPMWICYVIWYFDFYKLTTDIVPGNIKFANDISTIALIILSILNNVIYPLILITIKRRHLIFG